MRELAAFVSSEVGRVYAISCERWGVDPGAIFDDDVMAINARVGLARALAADVASGSTSEVLRLASRG